MSKQHRQDMREEYPINSMKLIQLVRAHECLYNQAANSYTDKAYKELVWETINKGLFEQYDMMSDPQKNNIRSHVRRRWKGLRDALARQVKKSATMENYCRKQESPMLSELEFLIPHIKSTYCARLADELNIRENYLATNIAAECNQEMLNSDCSDYVSTEFEDNSYDMIDLTAEEEEDYKPYIKKEDVHSDMYFSSHTISPTVQMFQSYEPTPITASPPTELVCAVVPNNVAAINMDGGCANIKTNNNNISSNNNMNAVNKTINIAATENWNNISFAQFKEGEFTTLLCSTQEADTEDLGNNAVIGPVCNNNSNDGSNAAELLKRQDSSNNTYSDAPQDELNTLKTRIVKLLNEMEKREGNTESSLQQQQQLQHQQQQNVSDEDRMFLMSLVPDLKRVPSAKKMAVKAEIVMAIANAIEKK